MVPLFSKALRFFPALVIGTMMTVIGVNLVKVGATLMFGPRGTPGYGDGSNVALGMITIAIIVAAVLFTRGAGPVGAGRRARRPSRAADLWFDGIGRAGQPAGA